MLGTRHILNDAAIFVSPESEDEWSDALITLANDDGLREEMGKRAYEQLTKGGYTWQENARRVFEFCHEILNKRNSAPGAR